MTGRDIPASDPAVRLLEEAGVPANPALSRALDGIGVLAAGPAPEASAELARLMAAGGRAPTGRRNKRRITFLGGALAVSMGVGMSGVAAGPFPFQGGSEDTTGAGSRFAARESADRIRDLPAPPAPSVKGAGDSAAGWADRSPAVPDVATLPHAAPGAVPVIEARPGVHVALPAGSAAPVEAGFGTAVTSRSGAGSTPSVAGSAAGAHPVLGDPAQPTGPSSPQRDAATSEGRSAAGPWTPGSGAGQGSRSPGPAAGAVMDVGNSADRAAGRGAGSVRRDPLGGSTTPDSGSGARGPFDRAAEHRTSDLSDDGGLAAVGPDRSLGGAAQGTPATVAGVPSQRDVSMTRLHASFWRGPSGASTEDVGLLGPVVAEEEGYGMFALFLGSAATDAGEWVPHDFLAVLPEDPPEVVDPEALDASTVDGPASVDLGAVDPSAVGPGLLGSITPAGLLEDTPDRPRPGVSDAVPDPVVSGQVEGEQVEVQHFHGDPVTGTQPSRSED